MKHKPQRSALPTVLQGAELVSRWLRHALRSFLVCIILAFSAKGSAALAATLANTPHFELTSPTIQTGASVPEADVGNRNNCKGGDQSPPLTWSHAPAGTASYAVSMADLDARVGVTWLWLMFNIPANVSSLAQNAAVDGTLTPPGALQARNGFDGTRYTGPCPSKGRLPHHYLITVWAVDQANLPFKEGTPAEHVAIFLRRHALGHASLTPHYGVH